MGAVTYVELEAALGAVLQDFELLPQHCIVSKPLLILHHPP